MKTSIRRARQRRLPRGQRVAAPATNGPSITLSEGEGVRYLHFGTEWIQGAMRIARPFALELEYQQQMMAVAMLCPQPHRIVQLGLGAAALAKFCWRYCAPAHVTAVELEPSVVEVARGWFRLPPDDPRLHVVIDDAREYITNPRHRHTADWLQVDLYDSAARGPVYDDSSFYRACHQALAGGGVAAFNLFGSQFDVSLQAIAEAFEKRWLSLPTTVAGNRIVLAWKDLLLPTLNQAHATAADLAARWRLPAERWLEGMVWPRPAVNDGG